MRRSARRVCAASAVVGRSVLFRTRVAPRREACTSVRGLPPVARATLATWHGGMRTAPHTPHKRGGNTHALEHFADVGRLRLEALHLQRAW